MKKIKIDKEYFSYYLNLIKIKNIFNKYFEKKFYINTKKHIYKNIFICIFHFLLHLIIFK